MSVPLPFFSHAGVTGTQRGFTLLEALVAITLAGVAFTIVLSGMGGVGRVSERVEEHTVARQLAESVLAQFAVNQADNVTDSDELIYQGVKYGYKLAFEDQADTPQMPLTVLRSGQRLKAVRIEVFWGEQPRLQSYVLSAVLFK